MAHTHAPAHKGPIWEVCECGATRRAAVGEPVGLWHACALCVGSESDRSAPRAESETR